jgi:hypothetical protein
VLASAPLNRSLSASFMRLPANCAHPERRASEIRLAIARVCQAVAVETTILTEQTEFSGRRQPPPTIAQQIFFALVFLSNWAAALCRSAEDRRPGRATGVTRLRAGLGLHVWAGREILVGEVVVVTATVVPISQDTVAGAWAGPDTNRPNIDCIPVDLHVRYLRPIPYQPARGRRAPSPPQRTLRLVGS